MRQSQADPMAFRPEVPGQLPLEPQAGALQGQPIGQAPASDLRSLLQARGVDTAEYANDQELVDYFVRSQQAMPQYQQLAAIGQQVLPYYDQFQQWLAQQDRSQGAAGSSAPAAPGAVAPEKPYWEPEPEWDDQWTQFLDWGVDGMPFVKGGLAGIASPDLPVKWLKHEQWRRNQAATLLRDPVEATWPGFEAKLEKWRQEKGFLTREEVERERQQSYVQQWTRENERWLYAQDSQGNPIINPQNGQQVYSQAGQLFLQEVQALEAAGVTDPVMQSNLALRLVQSRLNPQAAVPALNPPGAGGQPVGQAASPGSSPNGRVPPADFYREQFVSGAFHAPARDGSLAAQTGVPQNPGLSYGQMLTQNARLRGVTA